MKMASVYSDEDSSSDLDSNHDCKSCHGYQTKRNNNKCVVDRVSHWIRDTVELLGILYKEEPTAMHEFINILSNSNHKFVSGAPVKFTHPFKDKAKLLLDTQIDLTKDCVNVSLSVDENRPEFFKGTVRKEIAAARRKLWERRVKIDDEHEDDDGYTAELVYKKSGLSRFQLKTCYYHTYDFLKTYLHFLENGSDNKGWTKSDFTTLLSQFLTIFMLLPQPGKSNQRNQVLGGVPTSSVPGLRIFTDEQFSLSLGVVTVKEEKLRNIPCDKDLFSTEDIPADALGQHAGELLLEYEYSVFEEAVFGILCFRTKLIFTFLKMGDEHFQSILNHKDINDTCGRSTIYYTKPYDYLIKEQREEILELLFWLGLQTSVR